MRVVFARHGEQQRGEVDPALTSAGHSMARETGEWMASHQLTPGLCLVTETTRTRETADELLFAAPQVQRRAVRSLPETLTEWGRLVETWSPQIGDQGVLLLVGHHPTLHFLLEAFGPPPQPVPMGNYAAGLVVDKLFTGSWAISAAWPGRAR